MGAHFNVSFGNKQDNIKGTAEIEALREDDEEVYLARNIRFDNTEEELLEAELVVEPELRIKPVLDEETDEVYWVDADSEEESELVMLIGKAIEDNKL